MKYRSRPKLIEAVQWTGNNFSEIKAIVGDRLSYFTKEENWDDNNIPADIQLFISDVENCPIYLNEYVYKENGELFISGPNTFERNYEKVEL